ncbi:MAG TPA: hypothetical protein VLD59_14030 [Steroidobacteraceae bacterium]|nr:hypothetical protein [Steroidobacteraceae bacterium]
MKTGFGSRPRRLLCVIALSLAPNAEAQSRPPLKSCPDDSQIELSKLITLSDERHRGGIPLHPMSIARTEAGEYLLPSAELDRLFVFDTTGQIIRTIGTPSQPFKMITAILSAPDGSFRVYDRMSRTLSVLDRDLTLLRKYTFRYYPALLVENKYYIHNEHITTPELAGYPLHTIDESGAVLRSFGVSGDVYRADEPLRNDRVVTSSTGGMVWAAPPGKYLLERWDPLRGLRESSLDVQSAWFRESARFPRRGQRPSPIIESLWEVNGCIWVLLRDADSKWRAPPESQTERRFDPDEYDRTYDFILEVVAIDTAKVVASRRFDRALWGKGNSFMLMTRRSTTEGLTEVDVWQPQLVRQGRKR